MEPASVEACQRRTTPARQQPEQGQGQGRDDPIHPSPAVEVYTCRHPHLTSLKRLRLSSPVLSRKSFTVSTPPLLLPPLPGAALLPGLAVLPPAGAGPSCKAPLAAWLSTCATRVRVCMWRQLPGARRDWKRSK
jgi:hypothetical protein